MARLVCLILRAGALAMGISVVVLCQMRSITVGNALTMLGIGLTCLSISSLEKFADKPDKKD